MLQHFKSSKFSVETSVELFSTYINYGCEGEFDFGDGDSDDSDEFGGKDPSDFLELRGAKVQKLESMYALPNYLQLNFISLE